MDLLPHSDAITAILHKLASAEQEVANIMADADRRATPIRSEMSRYKIALEVLRALAPDAEPIGTISASVLLEPLTVTASGSTKETTRQLILKELRGSQLPLSKQELHERFIAQGRNDIKDTTVGSTLSNMLRDGELVKHGTNRYSLPVEIDDVEKGVPRLAPINEQSR